MANEEHLKILKQGVKAWNNWREENPDIDPDLSKAILSGADLSRANLSKANLSEAILGEADLSKAILSKANLSAANLGKAILREAYLSGAYLNGADLRGTYLRGANFNGAYLNGADLREAYLSAADLTGADLTKAILGEADLSGANLIRAKLSGADLIRANLNGADLSEAILSEADLSEANLTRATLVETDFTGADLTGCSIYGISAWDLKLEGATQTDLIITRRGEPTITVDNLEVAHFIYLLLNNEKIRDVIDTITSKVVLILGRFTDERKVILQAIRDELRKSDYLPVLFTFDKPVNRDFMETVSVLADLSRFVIADVTDPKIVLEEIPHIVRAVAVPVKPILEGPGDAPMTLSHLREDEPVTLYNLRRNHRSLLDTHWYKNLDDLLASLKEKVIAPAEAKARGLEKR